MRKIIYVLISVFVFGFSSLSLAQSQICGNVYAMTNAPQDNQIAIYERKCDGKISIIDYVNTGGAGAGDNAPVDPLGSQNSVMLSRDRSMLYVVNAGSNEISAFTVGNNGNLTLVQLVASHGDFPVSLTVNRDMLYVLNAGGSGNIVGYQINQDGELSLVPESIRDLGLNNPIKPGANEVPLSPGQVSFDRKNKRLIISNAGNEELLVFRLNRDNIPDSVPTSIISEGAVPFDFILTRSGKVVVAEASGSLSSYRFSRNTDILTPVSSVVTNGQQAVCWVVSNGQRFVFSINTGSSTISTYRIKGRGDLTLVNAVSVDTNGSLPIDSVITRNGRLLYVMNAISGDISGYRVNTKNGSLTLINSSAGLPNFSDDGITAQGIAVR